VWRCGVLRETCSFAGVRFFALWLAGSIERLREVLKLEPRLSDRNEKSMAQLPLCGLAERRIMMRRVLTITIALLVGALSIASIVWAREIERKVPVLVSPLARGTVAGTGFLVSQAISDTFYYGGTVWDGTDGRWEAAEPTAPGWTDRKMWTWGAGGFGGTPHSGLNMDGWVGVDFTTDVNDFFNVEDNTTIGACATSKVLFCGFTNAECEDACYADLNGMGYGNNWNQMVATPADSFSSGDVLTLSYDYANETEPGYDFSRVILQYYDSVAGAWADAQVLATYDDVVSGTDGPFDMAAYLAVPCKWRILFQFQSDGGWSDEDAWFPTLCGAFSVDNVQVVGSRVNWTENFESTPLNSLPSGWSKYVLGCGAYVRTEHISNLAVPVTLDPCVTAVPGWCTIEDSVLVFDDPAYPGYPHPHCQDNYALSPVIDFSGHPGLPGRLLSCERFGDLPLNDHVFMYWQARYKPGCPAGGWSPWLTDNYVYYTREGPSCATWTIDASSYLPPEAQCAEMAFAVINLCTEDPWWIGCSFTCNVTPYFDNVTFAVFGSDIAPYISMREIDYWQDQFSEDGTLSQNSTADSRTPNYLSDLVPPIFGDTLVCRGSADDMEVYFVFRMAKVGPAQSTAHDFFTSWFPGVTGGGWYEARMDTSEVTKASGVSTVPAPKWWMCTFHEDDPVRLTNALPECAEILPNNLFVPGTRIEYFLKSNYSGSSDFFLLPDTTGGVCEEFEVLPMMRDAGGIEWPCLIVADHFGQRGNGSERNSDRIARHLSALGYDFDVYNKLGPASDLRNGIGRWPANAGQIGGPGTDKYNWGSGATLSQFVGYKYCILNAGNVYAYSMYEQDASMLTSWLIYLTGPYHYRFLWVSGDQVCRELNRRNPWGPQFLNGVLCATYVASAYSSYANDYTYCLPMNGVTGGRILGGGSQSYVLRSNGCPAKLSVIDASSSSGCNAVPEIEYNAGHESDMEIASVSNDRTPCVSYYRTFTEGYDFCLIRTDDSQGPLACGTDEFLSAWFDSVLTWGEVHRSSWCGKNMIVYSVPDPERSTVEWRNLACDSTKAFVCPGSFDVWFGDTCRTSWLYVRAKDQFDLALPGVEVCAFFEDPTCDLSQCSPVVGYTDEEGELSLPVRAGLDVSGDTVCCSVTTTVKFYDAVFYTGSMEWLSPDMNADSAVTVEDSLIFMSDWLTSACRSDFNCDGIVDGLDLAIFDAHYWHACHPSLVSVEEMREALPAVWALGQNYPNPFNPYTSIRFSMLRPGRVVLRIFDIAGRPVRTLVDGWKDSGEHSEIWDGRGKDGSELSSGVYFYRLETAHYVTTKKMVLLK